MTGSEVSQWASENGECDARELLEEKCPGAMDELYKLVKGLDKLRKRVAKKFPEANWYLSTDTLNLMLGVTHGEFTGNTHSDTESNPYKAHQERVGASAYLPTAGGGDW